MEMCDRIKYQRQRKGITLDEIANAVGVSNATVSRWETGEIKNIRKEKIEPLAKALKTTTAYLQGYIDDPDAEIRLYSLNIPTSSDGMAKVIFANSADNLADELATSMRDEAAELLLTAAKPLCQINLITPEGKAISVFGRGRVNVIAEFIKDNEKSLRMMIEASESDDKKQQPSSSAEPDGCQEMNNPKRAKE